MRKHHRTSPSTLNGREACPLYEPQQNENEHSKAGELQHAAMESGDDARLDDEQASAVIRCRGEIARIEASYGTDPLVVREKYFSIDDENTTGGFADLVLVARDHAKAAVIDFKFGKHAQTPAEENLQGICYVLGVMRAWPDLPEVELDFIYPYLGFTDNATFKREQFDALYLRVKTVIDRVNSPAARAFPNTGTCLFCARRGECLTLHKTILRIGKKYSPLEVPDLLDPALTCDPVAAGRLKQLAQIVKKWAESVNGVMLQRALSTANWLPTGYRLVASAKRKVIDISKFRTIANEYGIDNAALDALTDIPIGHVEKQISMAAPRGTKTACVAAFGEKLEAAGAVETGPMTACLRMERETD